MNSKQTKYTKLFSLFLLLYSFAGITSAQIWEYTVQKGDTLWGIADENFIDVRKFEELRILNKVENPFLLQPGRQIFAPIEWLSNVPGQAKLISSTGRVIIQKSQQQDGSDENTINTDDLLITDGESSATVEFSDKSRVNIYSDSQIKFKVINQSVDGKVLKARIAVEKGRIDIKANPDKKSGHRLEIESPSAVTAVRGTSFRVAVDKTDADTIAEILAGKVDFNSDGRNTNLSKGLGIKTMLDGDTIPPVDLFPAPEIMSSQTHDLRLGALKWEKNENATSYRVRVSSEEDFSAVIYDKVTTANEVTDIYFHHNGPHYASVRAIDTYDIEGFDGIANLDVKIYPLPPLIVKPLNRSVTKKARPVFSWSNLTNNIKQVRIQLASDSLFDNKLIDTVVNANKRFKSSEELSQGTYFWRVAGIGQDGRGSFSPSAKFTVK